jgi:hypothetical protein
MTSSFTSIHFPASDVEVAEYDSVLAERAQEEYDEFLDKLDARAEYNDRWCQC